MAPDDRLVTLWAYRDLPEALLAQAKLESAGIDSALFNAEMVRIGWPISDLLGGVQLKVKDSERDEALAVLQEATPDRDSADEVANEQLQRRASIVVATSNPGKLKEFRDIAQLYEVHVNVLPAASQVATPQESGSTYEENACIKAVAYSRVLPGQLVIADDSGLEVDALGGIPGVHSARYASDIVSGKPTDADNNHKLLAELARLGRPERTARFVCVIAMATDGEVIKSFRGEAHGEILQAPLGKHGFGYDPLFFVPAADKTFAEMNAIEKAAHSHRGAAFRNLLDYLGSSDATIPNP